MKRIVVSIAVLLVLAGGMLLNRKVVASNVLSSSLNEQKSVEVTVYNSNLGLVKDSRRLQLPKGTGEIKFTDVAAQIMPFTVQIKALSSPDDLSILEQNYEYDLMDQHKLLDKYVGKTIKLVEHNQYLGKSETTEAELLSNNNGQIFKIGDEIHLGHGGDRILPQLPEDLVATPTLTWMYQNNSAKQDQEVQVSYLTNGINWKADYVLVVDDKDVSGNLSGWVTLDNQSGTTYRNAKLKLVAGDVNRVRNDVMEYEKSTRMLAMSADAAAPGFQEKSFFEYHIYDLQRPTTIKEKQSKQINLLQANTVGLSKEFRIYGNQSYFYNNYGTGQPIKVPVEVYLKFKNAKDNHLGMPLPQGTVRLYKEDHQQSLQFIGEDAIMHTPKDEFVQLKIGEAFDLSASRVSLDFRQAGTTYEVEWELKVRNHKDSDAAVAFLEPMWGDWDVLSSSHPYQKIDATTIRFDVSVPKDGEVAVKYRVSIKRP